MGFCAYAISIYDELKNGTVEICKKLEEFYVKMWNQFCVQNGIVDAYTEDENGVCKERPTRLGHIYLSVKKHKKNHCARFIVGGSKLASTPLSKVVSIALREVMKTLRKIYSNMFMMRTGITLKESSILKDTDDFIEHLNELNNLKNQQYFNLQDFNVSAKDFTNLYPSPPHDDLQLQISKCINVAFDWQTRDHQKKYKNCTRACLLTKKYPECNERDESATWTNKYTDKQHTEPGLICISKEMLVQFTTYLIRESYFTYGKQVWHITRGFPTGTNAAPEMANLYLLAYELAYFERQTRKWQSLPIHHKVFILSYKRFIDDVFHLESKTQTESFLYKSPDKDGIFPKSLCDKGNTIDMPLQLNGGSGKEANFLDITVMIDSAITYKLYDKRKEMYVSGKRVSELPNFPNINSNLAQSCKYGVLSSQLYRFARRNTKATEVIKNTIHLCKKMMRDGYNKDLIKGELVKFKKWPKKLGKWGKILKVLLNGIR